MGVSVQMCVNVPASERGSVRECKCMGVQLGESGWRCVSRVRTASPSGRGEEGEAGRGSRSRRSPSPAPGASVQGPDCRVATDVETMPECVCRSPLKTGLDL